MRIKNVEKPFAIPLHEVTWVYIWCCLKKKRKTSTIEKSAYTVILYGSLKIWASSPVVMHYRKSINEKHYSRNFWNQYYAERIYFLRGKDYKSLQGGNWPCFPGAEFGVTVSRLSITIRPYTTTHVINLYVMLTPGLNVKLL